MAFTDDAGNNGNMQRPDTGRARHYRYFAKREQGNTILPPETPEVVPDFSRENPTKAPAKNLRKSENHY